MAETEVGAVCLTCRAAIEKPNEFFSTWCGKCCVMCGKPLGETEEEIRERIELFRESTDFVCKDCEIVCNACGGLVSPTRNWRSDLHIATCKPLEQLRDLGAFEYEYAPYLRSAGGPYMMKRPDGTVLHEKDFGVEIDKLLST